MKYKVLKYCLGLLRLRSCWLSFCTLKLSFRIKLKALIAWPTWWHQEQFENLRPISELNNLYTCEFIFEANLYACGLYFSLRWLSNVYNSWVSCCSCLKFKSSNIWMAKWKENTITSFPTISLILPFSFPLPSLETEKPNYAHFHKTTVDCDIGAPELG